MRKWIAGLLALTALSPVAASAQEPPSERDGRPARVHADVTVDGGDAPAEFRAPPRPNWQSRDRGPRADAPRLDRDGPDRDGPGRDGGRGRPRFDGPRQGGEWTGPDRQWVGRPGEEASPRPDPRPASPNRPDRDWRNDGRPGRDWRDRDAGRGGWRSPRASRPDRDVGRGGDWTRSRFDDRGGDWWRGSSFGGGGGWDRRWRDDRRYDGNGYRGAHRDAFRLPRYYAPSGWSGGYRRFGIGAGLSASLWSQDYWIDDPYAYRLPEAYGPYRWVRYYDDALLVDVRTGVVIDAAYGIFW